MNFIQFESARNKEKARQELREVRAQMLEKAEKLAAARAEREAQKVLSGEAQWIHPSVANKLEKLSKVAKKSKKSKDKKKKKKKAKKTKKLSNRSSSKKRKRKSSTSSESSGDSSSDSDDELENERKQKNHKKKRSRKECSSTSDSDSDSSSLSSSKWVEKTQEMPTAPLQRDSWMTDGLMLKTYTRERDEKKLNEKQQQQIDAYDPKMSTRELNPYWKTTGTGLPSFQKPTDDDDNNISRRRQYPNASISNPYSDTISRSWRKNDAHKDVHPIKTNDNEKREVASSCSSDSSSSENESLRSARDNRNATNSKAEIGHILTDQQMNDLAAKALKAELMGDMNLATQLKEKLERARSNRTSTREKLNKANKVEGKKHKSQKEEHILLTRTDERGNCRPLAQAKSSFDSRDLYGGRSGSRKKQPIETHVSGERVRYFPDDDKYDIKQMFEREKYTNAADSNLQFANIASKHKNPNDDLEDIFVDKIRKNDMKEDSDKKEYQRAVHEHQRMAALLEQCDKCFDSNRMDKKKIVAMGEKAYLTLPWYIGLQTGHCMIVPTQHVSCCTQLDEDTWEEITNFRKALVRMFAAQNKDVIFYEIANKLQRRPHLEIHCIPVSSKEHGEMVPFYFKKAIEESEHEWSVNKQLVSLRSRSLRSSIPKGLPYFWVNFGLDNGFAHVIEDEGRFPANFAQEIIGGMLQLDANRWRKPRKEQNIISKVNIFVDCWKKYEITQ